MNLVALWGAKERLVETESEAWSSIKVSPGYILLGLRPRHQGLCAVHQASVHRRAIWGRER